MHERTFVSEFKVCVQLVHAYSEVCERIDQSLFHHGFVQDTSPPRLAALDIPNGSLYEAVAFNETDYGMPYTVVCLNMKKLSVALPGFDEQITHNLPVRCCDMCNSVAYTNVGLEF